MKRLILIFCICLLPVSYSLAQPTQLNAKVAAGLPVGEVSDFSSLILAANLEYLFRMNNLISLGLGASYLHSLSKNIESGGMQYNLRDDAFLLLRVLLLYQFVQEFFLDVGAGYAFGLKEDSNGGVNLYAGLWRSLFQSGLQVGVGYNRISINNDFGDNTNFQDIRLMLRIPLWRSE